MLNQRSSRPSLISIFCNSSSKEKKITSDKWCKLRREKDFTKQRSGYLLLNKKSSQMSWIKFAMMTSISSNPSWFPTSKMICFFNNLTTKCRPNFTKITSQPLFRTSLTPMEFLAIKKPIQPTLLQLLFRFSLVWCLETLDTEYWC